jgi:hypothetical protein
MACLTSTLLRGRTRTLPPGVPPIAYYTRIDDDYAEIIDIEAVISPSQLPRFIAVVCIGVRG